MVSDAAGGEKETGSATVSATGRRSGAHHHHHHHRQNGSGSYCAQSNPIEIHMGLRGLGLVQFVASRRIQTLPTADDDEDGEGDGASERARAVVPWCRKR